MLKMHFSGARPVLSASILMAVEIQARWNHSLDLSYVCFPKVGASRLSIITAMGGELLKSQKVNKR